MTTATIRARAFLPALLLGLGLMIGGCRPLQFTFTLGPERGELSESIVGGDRNASAKIAMIEVRGLIADGSEPSLFGAAGNPVDRLHADLAQAADDSSVKAVLLRISSPGGTVAASDTMYREIVRFRESTGKPVIAHFGEIATSGGYYIALACDLLIAEPASITGSIGVITPTLNMSEGLEKIGFESRAVRSGQNKDIANPLEPIQESHYEILQSIVDDFYQTFRSLVQQHRTGIDPADLDRVTDGRVFTGRQALEAGLVDETGGVWDAFDSAKTLAGVQRAKLTKYYVGRSAPTSPYSVQTSPQPLMGGDFGINRLIQTIDPMSRTGAGVYYLWVPPAP